MDISKLDVRAASSEGADLHLRHPFTGDRLYDDGEPVMIRVIGRDSPKVLERVREVERAKARGEEIDDDDYGREFFALVTVGWQNIHVDGEKVPYTPENARRLYDDPRTEWIGEQVGPFALRRRNFQGNLPKL